MVLRTQQFSDGTIFTNSTWRKACRRPIPLITVSKSCSSCHMLRQFAARTLLTAPKHFPAWKCSHLGMECNEDADAIIFTVPPEQWQLASQERSFSHSQDALPSFPFDKHSQRPPSTAVSVPKTQPAKGPEIFDVATPPRTRATRELAINSPREDVFRPLQHQVDLRPLSQREKKSVPYDLLSDRGSDSDSSQKSPSDFLTWTQIPSEKRLVCERSSTLGISRNSSSLRRATPSHFMVGDPLDTHDGT